MTGKSGLVMGSLLGVALLTGSAAMAQGQPRTRYPQANEQESDAPDDVDQRAAPGRAEEAAPPARADDDFSDVAGSDQPPLQRSEPEAESDRAAPSGADDQEVEAMTDACARAARDEAEREGGYAEVRQMERPREDRNGFSIDGDVETRTNWRTQDGRMRHFTCTIANGRIEDVYFQRDRAIR